MDGFNLTIEFGNDAMAGNEDCAAALRDVADRVENGSVEGKVTDANGNTVGEFYFHDA